MKRKSTCRRYFCITGWPHVWSHLMCSSVISWTITIWCKYPTHYYSVMKQWNPIVCNKNEAKEHLLNEINVKKELRHHTLSLKYWLFQKRDLVLGLDVAVTLSSWRAWVWGTASLAIPASCRRQPHWISPLWWLSLSGHKHSGEINQQTQVLSLSTPK